MFTERLSSDRLFQQSVSSLSAETLRRVDSVLEVILLRSGLLYLPGFVLTSCRQAAATVCPRPYPPPVGAEALCAAEHRADGNVAVLSHAEYVPTLTAAAALRVKAALSKAVW